MATMTDEEIKIKAEVLDAGRCRLSVDRPVLRTGGSLQFRDRAEAQRHPLAEMVFGVEGVSGLLLSGSNVIVERTETAGERGPEDWVPIARQVGRAIRAYLKSQGAEMAASPSDVAGVADATGGLEDRIRVKVQQILDTQINPGVAAHGGQVQLLEVRGGDIYIKMGGGCQGCGMASVTLKQGVERTIRQFVPEVARILDITDHASGQNPYYSPGKQQTGTPS